MFSSSSYQNAINVGEETGQPLLSNGGMSRFTLSNTKLSCYTSLSEIYMPCNNNDTKKGVIPDYKVIPTIEDLLNDKDYTLEYTLNLIRKNIPKN
jgi:hypothetical protein